MLLLYILTNYIFCPFVYKGYFTCACVTIMISFKSLRNLFVVIFFYLQHKIFFFDIYFGFFFWFIFIVLDFFLFFRFLYFLILGFWVLYTFILVFLFSLLFNYILFFTFFYNNYNGLFRSININNSIN